MYYADAHADVFYEAATRGADIVSGHNTIHVTLDGMRGANQRLQVCSLWTPPAYSGDAADSFAGRILDALDHTVTKHPSEFVKIRHRHELRRCIGATDNRQPTDMRIALIPWIEGGSPLRGSLDVFERYAARGVKGIGLVWNHANEIADGCGVKGPRRGLTTFGHDLVRAMETRRVLVDLAHCPEPAFWDVVKHARRPVVVTHTGMRSLVGITRNITDAMARAVANSGGFVGIDFYPGHVFSGTGKPCARQATLDDLADHILHAVSIVGAQNVVLGGDFDGFRDPIKGLEHVRHVPRIAEVLARRGLSSRHIEGVMGRNLAERLIELW